MLHAARDARGHRAGPAPDHQAYKGSSSDRHHRRREHAELQPAEGTAVLVLPVAVRAYIDDEFTRSSVTEQSVAFSHMPPFKDKTVRLESHCACCMEPIRSCLKNFEMQSVTPPRSVLAHLAVALRLEQRRHGADVRRDDYVIDAAHAERLRRRDLDSRRAREPRPGEDVRAGRRQRHMELPLGAWRAESRRDQGLRRWLSVPLERLNRRRSWGDVRVTNSSG